MFPLDEFEPTQTTLKDIGDFLDRQDAITARFIATSERRRTYWQQLVDLIGRQLSVIS